jgi:presenilin-like A22 family membrane protease
VGEQEKEDNFKFQIVYLVPILASLVFGLGCAYLIAPHQTELIPQSTPFTTDTPGAPVVNGLYFVVLLAISATVFYILLKRRSQRIIKALIVVAMTTASLLLSLVYLSALFANFPSWAIWLVVSLSLVLTVLFDLAVFKLGGVARNTAVICVGGALGVFFGSSILQFGGLYSVILILTFLAIYDIFAVYRGPVGKIAQSSGLDDLQGLSYSFKDIQMGLGDLVFYSMLIGTIFFNFIGSPWGFLPCLVSIIGIMAGSIITLFMLERKGIFPGLPFPILLGLAGGLITGFLILPFL